jgi:hypothetical protein
MVDGWPQILTGLLYKCKYLWSIYNTVIFQSYSSLIILRFNIAATCGNKIFFWRYSQLDLSSAESYRKVQRRYFLNHFWLLC